MFKKAQPWQPLVSALAAPVNDLAPTTAGKDKTQDQKKAALSGLFHVHAWD